MTPHEIIEDYNGQPHVRGTVDCNLLFLKIHEPEIYEKMYKRYSTIVGGVRSARKYTGYTSIKDVLDNSGNYVKIDKYHQLPMDVVVFDDRHDVYISLGNKFFGVNDQDIFSVFPMTGYEDYHVYRKREK